MRVALGQGASGARGKFSDTLDALTVLLHERSRSAVRQGNEALALGAAKAIELVEEAKETATRNVNPQLLTASLLTNIGTLVR
jgi:DNA polymerase-3 subunit delta'